MGIAIQPNVRSVLDQIYVDFTTGVKLTNYSLPLSTDRVDALRRYLAVAEQYQSVMEPGWWNFPGPDALPEDLLMPFRDLVVKYNLTAAATQIHATTAFGDHNALDSLTMWIMRSFGVDMVRTDR